MMKNLIDPRLPRAVLRAAILETFVALSDKWIFEVCCHASSQDSSLCPSDVSRLKIARLFLASITFVLIVFIEKTKDCQMSNVHMYQLWISIKIVPDGMPRTTVLGRLDSCLPRVGVLIELSVSHPGSVFCSIKINN